MPRRSAVRRGPGCAGGHHPDGRCVLTGAHLAEPEGAGRQTEATLRLCATTSVAILPPSPGPSPVGHGRGEQPAAAPARSAAVDGYSLVRRAGGGLEPAVVGVWGLGSRALVVVRRLKQRLETSVHVQTGTSSSRATPPSNAPVGSSYSEGGAAKGRRGRGRTQDLSAIGSRSCKSRIGSRPPQAPNRAGIFLQKRAGPAPVPGSDWFDLLSVS